jgi:hypothetical protein
MTRYFTTDYSAENTAFGCHKMDLVNKYYKFSLQTNQANRPVAVQCKNSGRFIQSHVYQVVSIILLGWNLGEAE